MPNEHNLSIIQRMGVTAEHLKTAVMVSGGILLANLLDRKAMVVHANDPLVKQAALAIPSALPAPELIGPGHEAVDIAGQIGTTAISLLAAQSDNNTSPPELAIIGIGTQIGSCAIDAAIERTGWLTQAERAQEDVGFSAISVAWFTKFLLDRASQSETHARRWYAGLGVFGISVSVLLPLADGGQGSKLDAASHAVGLAAGVGGYLWSKKRRQVQPA